MKKITAILLLFLIFHTEAWAGFKEGVEAYDRADYAAAIKEFTPLAKEGQAKAQWYLGHMYFRGYGVPVNHQEALTWARKSAEQGFSGGQILMGMIYSAGGGVPRDIIEAGKWFELAADQGHAGAQFEMAFLCFKGKDIPKDTAKAIKYLRQAAAQGYGPAQLQLGVLLLKGDGVPQDQDEAVKLFMDAAENGYPSGQVTLAVVMKEGNHPDVVQAYMWALLAFQGATKAKDEKTIAAAKGLLEELTAKMSREQITQAQAAAGAWRPKKK